MSKRFEFSRVDREYVENYENLERKYGIYSASARRLVELANIPFKERIEIIEEIIERTKKRFREEGVRETPKVFDVLAVKP